MWVTVSGRGRHRSSWSSLAVPRRLSWNDDEEDDDDDDNGDGGRSDDSDEGRVGPHRAE